MRRQPKRDNARGTVIIHVAFALMALLVFTSIIIDYGVMWVSRRQAQNVVDSAALAGALASIRDGGSPQVINEAAHHFAATNPIWGQANSDTNVDVALSGPGSDIPPCGEEPGCVRVDVFRYTPDRTNGAPVGNVLPTYFARLVDLDAQGVRATATAETVAGNTIKCLLPFAVADRWSDATDPTPDTDTYLKDADHLTGDPISGWSPNDFYEDALAAPPGLDTYVAPYPGSMLGPDGHTGWTVDDDYGRQLVLKKGAVGQFSSGWSNKVDLPGSVGGADFLADIKGCNDTPVAIAQPGETCVGYPTSGTTADEAAHGCLGVGTGVTTGPTEHGIESGGPGGPSVLEQDPNAVWNWGVTGPQGQNGAVVVSNANNALNMSSPRVRPIAIFDIAHYMNNPSCVNQAGTGCVIRVANIVGFFVEGMCDEVAAANRLDPGQNCSPNPEGKREVVGRLVTLPSMYYGTGGDVADDAAFLKMVRLVR